MKHYYRRSDGSHIQQLALQSLLFSPHKRSLVQRGNGTASVTVSGVAYSGGDNAGVAGVEVSLTLKT